MALVAPIAGAAVGGLATGWSGWGMSVGWLVGSWLFGPKAETQNQIFDPGAEELPRFNQALRGVTIPVLFGTNRVSSNIVWRNRFRTVRSESTQGGGGGGKGGGSGMGSKGGGAQTTNVTYEYFIDLMFSFGMSDENFNLFGGWLDGERLNDATLLGIINNSGSSSTFFRSATSRPNNAELSYEEGFFHGALATSDASADNWAHFESVVGSDHRFPYTVYLGVKQMSLGGSARIPQLTWEVGPGDITFESDSAYVGQADTQGVLSDYMSSAPEGGWIKGEDGKLYVCETALGIVEIWDTETATLALTLTQSQLATDTSGVVAGRELANNEYTLSNNSAVVMDKNLILIWDSGQQPALPFSAEYLFGLYKINSSSQLEYVGGWSTSSLVGQLAWIDQQPQVMAYGAGTDDDNLIAAGPTSNVGYFGTTIWRLPSVNYFKANVSEFDQDENRLHGIRANYTQSEVPFGTDNFYWHTRGNYLTEGVSYSGHATMVPIVRYDALFGLPFYEMLLWKYINVNVMRWHADSPGGINRSPVINSLAGGFYGTENGIDNACIVEYYLQNSSDPDTLAGFNLCNSYAFVNSRFINPTGNVVMPFSGDDGFNRIGTQLNGIGYYNEISNCRLTTGVAAGANLLTFWKCLNNNNIGAINSPESQLFSGYNTYGKFRLFIWNPIDGTATQYGEQEYHTGRRFQDLGILSVSPIGEYSRAGYFDEDSGVLYQTHYQDGADDYAYTRVGNLSIGGGEDVTPPYIIYKILTSTVYGIGINEADIDSTSYGLAIQYCESENIKVSCQFTREESALQIIDELLAVYGGYLIDSAGKIKFGIQEFSSSPIRTIDNSRLRIEQKGEAPVQVTKGARQDTYNKVKVNYIDRNLEYRQNFVEIADEVDQDINGVRAREFPPRFVMSRETAYKIAERALWGNLYARDIFEFKLGPKDCDLEPGDVVTLVDSFNPQLSSGRQVRIVEWSESQPLMFNVRAVEEVEYINEAGNVASEDVTEASSTTLFGAAAPPAYFQAYELPQEFQGADARLYVGYRQQGDAMGSNLYVSADGVSFTKVGDKQPFIISGIVAEGMPARAPGFVEQNVEVYLMPDTRSTAFDPTTPTYCQTYALEDAGANTRALGGSNMWINSEMMAYEGVNLIAQNHYRFDKVYRGWGGTHIQAHNSGDTWWRHSAGIHTQILNQDKVGNLIYYKVQPYNFAGVGYNISSIDAKTYQIQGTYWRPQNQTPIDIFVQSPSPILTVQSENLNLQTKKSVVAGGSNVWFEWPDGARLSGYGALGYGYLTYGEFATDTTSHNWRVEVLSNDYSTVVRCLTVDTTAWVYSSDITSTDFNGWTGNFGVRVTPYNTLGDALRSRTVSLELFE